MCIRDRDETILDAEGKNRHFSFSSGNVNALLDTTFKIMDMTLKNGEVTNVRGGLIVSETQNNLGHSILIQNVKFESNRSLASNENQYDVGGGAIYVINGAPYLRDVIFTGNYSQWRGGAVQLNNDTTGTAVFERAVFHKNYVTVDFSQRSLDLSLIHI